MANPISSYFKGARQRAQRRKSPWNLILILFSIVGFGLFWFSFAQVLSLLQKEIFLKNTIFSGQTFFGSFLMYIPLVFPSICLGFLTANLLAWLIQPARRTFDREADGVKGTSFKESMKGLMKLTLVSVFAVTPVCLMGINSYFYITEAGIYLSLPLSVSEKHYNWSDIKEIYTECLINSEHVEFEYELAMSDGKHIDLMREAPNKFADIYYRLQPFLQYNKGIVHRQNVTSEGLKQLQERYDQKYAGKILEMLRQEKALRGS